MNGEITGYLQNYLPIIVFFVVAFAVSVILIVLPNIAAVRKGDDEKNSPYECGFEPFESTRMKFDVKFYLVALLFLIFDLEIIFLFPWAVYLKNIGTFGFWSMIVFLFILTIGFVYEWLKGALDWS